MEVHTCPSVTCLTLPCTRSSIYAASCIHGPHQIRVENDELEQECLIAVYKRFTMKRTRERHRDY